MISHKYKFVIILLPKTGTTSIQNFLASKDRKTTCWPGPERHYDEIKENVKDYYMTSTCRNPYDRVVSLWKYWDNRLRYRGHLTTEFSYFVKDYERMQKKICRVFNKYEKIHFCTCVDSVALSTDNRLSHTDIDFWVKTENLQQDFNIVCDKIGIPRQQLPHENKTRHKHYTEYYDDETRSIVAERYARDIERFGYKFGE
jgi:hypothetical protein